MQEAEGDPAGGLGDAWVQGLILAGKQRKVDTICSGYECW